MGINFKNTVIHFLKNKFVLEILSCVTESVYLYRGCISVTGPERIYNNSKSFNREKHH